MSVAAAWIATLVLAGIAVFQILAIAGQPVGHFLWGGQHRVLPTKLRVGSAISLVLYAAMSALLFSRAGVLPGGTATAIVVASWVLFGYFALGVVMNGISRSRAERAVMTPACVALAGATLVVALGV